MEDKYLEKLVKERTSKKFETIPHKDIKWYNERKLHNDNHKTIRVQGRP